MGAGRERWALRGSGEGAGRGGEYGDWGLGGKYRRRGLGIEDGDWGNEEKGPHTGWYGTAADTGMG